MQGQEDLPEVSTDPQSNLTLDQVTGFSVTPLPGSEQGRDRRTAGTHWLPVQPQALTQRNRKRVTEQHNTPPSPSHAHTNKNPFKGGAAGMAGK